jgi:hypothetical protein
VERAGASSCRLFSQVPLAWKFPSLVGSPLLLLLTRLPHAASLTLLPSRCSLTLQAASRRACDGARPKAAAADTAARTLSTPHTSFALGRCPALSLRSHVPSPLCPLTSCGCVALTADGRVPLSPCSLAHTHPPLAALRTRDMRTRQPVAVRADGEGLQRRLATRPLPTHCHPPTTLRAFL